MAKISPQKNYKIKPTLITQHVFWRISQVLFEVWCIFKCYSFRCPKANFCFSSSIFSMISSALSLSHFLKKQELWLSENIISMKTQATVSTSNFLIPLLTTYNSFFPLCTNSIQNILNSHNNITNVPTKLYLSQMTPISGSHHFISS